MEDNENVTPEQLSEEQMNALDNPAPTNREIPMNDAEAAAQAPTAPEKPVEDSYEFTHGGKTIKATRDQLIKWAQQGIDYPQKAAKLNQQLQGWQKERGELEKKYSPYQKVDEWAAKNPGQWQSLQQMWQQAQSNPNATAQDFNAIKEALKSELITAVKPALDYVQTEQEKREDDALNTEIQSLREKHPDLDWNSVDELGRSSLEFKVLEHAQKFGIPTFKAAFRDLYHDELLSNAQAQAKQSVAKGIQTKTKLGILSESSSSKKSSFSGPKDTKKQSYEDLEREALDELRAGKVS